MSTHNPRGRLERNSRHKLAAKTVEKSTSPHGDFRPGVLGTIQGHAKGILGRIALMKMRKILLIIPCRGQHVDGELCIGSVRKRWRTRMVGHLNMPVLGLAAGTSLWRERYLRCAISLRCASSNFVCRSILIFQTEKQIAYDVDVGVALTKTISSVLSDGASLATVPRLPA